MKKIRRRERNLDSLLNLFSFRAFFKIGNHTKPSAAVFDESDGGSPPPESFNRTILWFKLEILEQIPLHCLFLFLSNGREIQIQRVSMRETKTETAQILNIDFRIFVEWGLKGRKYVCARSMAQKDAKGEIFGSGVQFCPIHTKSLKINGSHVLILFCQMNHYVLFVNLSNFLFFRFSIFIAWIYSINFFNLNKCLLFLLRKSYHVKKNSKVLSSDKKSDLELIDSKVFPTLKCSP